jgi:dUTP pyrophosphatase
MIDIKIERCRDGVILPGYAHKSDSGFDLRWHPAVRDPDKLDGLVAKGDRYSFETGLKFGIPHGYELQIRSKSGLGILEGLVVTNQPGTVDSGYDGEVVVSLLNVGGVDRWVVPGQKIAQGVFAPVKQAIFSEGTVSSGSSRGVGGFGSTGE